MWLIIAIASYSFFVDTMTKLTFGLFSYFFLRLRWRCRDRWCRSHDDECRKMAACAGKIYETFVSQDAALDYVEMVRKTFLVCVIPSCPKARRVFIATFVSYLIFVVRIFSHPQLHVFTFFIFILFYLFVLSHLACFLSFSLCVFLSFRLPVFLSFFLCCGVLVYFLRFYFHFTAALKTKNNSNNNIFPLAQPDLPVTSCFFVSLCAPVSCCTSATGGRFSENK